jgi:hypothetical protein
MRFKLVELTAHIQFVEGNTVDKHKLHLAETRIRDQESKLEYEQCVQRKHEADMAIMQVLIVCVKR